MSARARTGVLLWQELGQGWAHRWGGNCQQDPEFPDCTTAQVGTELCVPRYPQSHDQCLGSGGCLVSIARGCPSASPLEQGDLFQSQDI